MDLVDLVLELEVRNIIQEELDDQTLVLKWHSSVLPSRERLFYIVRIVSYDDGDVIFEQNHTNSSITVQNLGRF